MKNLIILLILGLLVHQHQVNCFFSLALQLVQFAWSTFEVGNTVHDTHSKFSTPSTADLMDKSEEIAQSLENWGGRIEDKIQQSVDLLLTRLPLLGEISGDVRLLNTYLARIDTLYSDYRHYLEDSDAFDEDELKALIEIFMSRRTGDVQDTVTMMFKLIVPQGVGSLKKSLFTLLAQEAKEFSLETCDTNGSPQQRLIGFYDILVETEMRAYMMTIFGYTMDGYLRGVNRTSSMVMVRDKLLGRAKEYPKILKNTIGEAPTVFRQCDPPGGHERGVTYHEFEKFMTGFVVSQQIFQFNHQCPKTCEDYSESNKLYHDGCKGAMCQRNDQGCTGQLAECSTMTGKVSYCLNNGSDARRFQWFQDKENIYGDSSNGCSAQMQYAEGSNGCAICRCICLEAYMASKSNRFISLREHKTNVKDNMVATGVRLVMKNRILWVQLRQGKLGPAVDIAENSTSWVELENYQYDEERSKVYGWSHFVRKNAAGKVEAVEDGNTIFTLTTEKKTINLDFLSAPADHVITGVRFQLFSNGGPTQVQLGIHVTSFNAETGALNIRSGHWIEPTDMPYAKKNEKKRIDYGKVEGKRNPAESRTTRLDTAPYTFIDLDYSSMEYDAAQTVIPLIDAIPVTTQPPIPIISIGLYHKKQTGYGGFLTFVVEGVNMATYIPTDIPS